MNRILEIIDTLNLKPHPEGGYFKETYRSQGEIGLENLPKEYRGNRNYSTCIYFLLTSEMFSAFHRIKQDEVWHFHEGSCIQLHTISENEEHEEHYIGLDLSKGERPQLIVPGGDWFAAKVTATNSYALVSCTVAPGFDFDDFELPEKKELIARFPQHEVLITTFNHS